MKRLLVLTFSLAVGACASAPAPMPPAAPVATAVVQRERPVPYPVDLPVTYARALERGTRAASGAPGARYWQQSAEYDLTARLDADARRLEGTARIRYQNNSPDTLPVVWVQLSQNLHKPGVERGEESEVTGGVELKRVSAGGTTLAETRQGTGYEVNGTMMAVRLPAPLAPGGSVELAIDWAFGIAAAGAGGRMGWSEDNLFYLAYWYPHMAVYDDVVGWQRDPFRGGGEFYADFATYRYTVDAPAGWIVVGTGELQNADAVLAADTRVRLDRVAATDSVVTIVGPADFTSATQPGRNGRLVWTFSADSVRDIAFSVTRESTWDAARSAVGDRDGDGRPEYTRVDAIWRAAAPFWKNAAAYGAHAIGALSRYTGLIYPWSHMSSVEAASIIGGGMEYPMMTLIGDYNTRGDSALYSVIAHEFAHMWVPMILSTDERRYGWMDEGMTSFNENQVRKEFHRGVDTEAGDRNSYLTAARAGTEGEMMRWTDYHYPGAGNVASYGKPATVLVALRGVLGAETFNRAYREFYNRWAFKHPYPWDFFNTIEDVSGRDLDWFWRSWYYETWVLDQAVAAVTETPGGVIVSIEDRGRVPMPVHLRVTRAGGAVVEQVIPVDVWLTGARRTQVTLPAGGTVQRVEIDAASQFPDVDRTNNVWVR